MHFDFLPLFIIDLAALDYKNDYIIFLIRWKP